MLYGILISAALAAAPADTLTLPAAVATAFKEENAASVTRISARQLRDYGVDRPKDVGALVPGIHLPDYGASLTSTIYVRGFGSRIDNPVMGLVIDDIPILDKNNYDTDYLDIASIHFLHGPQGTAYGRNALYGLMSVRTAAPDGTQRLTALAEYGSAHHIKAQVSWSRGNNLFSAGFRHSSGFFRNEYKNAQADPYNGGMFRWRQERQAGNLSLSTLVQAALSSEGGFAYGLYRDGVRHPVSYNDEAGYKRASLLAGFKLRYRGAQVVLDGITSTQVLVDQMLMDQDYTPESIFTLEQRQISPAQTLEVIARPARVFEHWKPRTGFFGFFKYNNLFAPVLFRRDGIEKLILANANAGIPDDIGTLEIPSRSFPVNSSFDIFSWNAALYHESLFTLGRWQLTAGLRIDYEGARMLYDCFTILHYRMLPYMPEARAYRDTYTGTLGHGSLQFLPKLAVQYDGPGNWHFSFTAAKGHRAGGFNTQIFSDILQSRIMNGMMADMGVYPDRPAVSIGADKTEYRPEEAWNFELGAGYGKNGLRMNASLYYIAALRQQLTVFPPGMSTGRMMTNAGKSRSFGAEASALYRKGGFHAHAAYSWNNARFVEFRDGQADYGGKRIPYSPAHTLFAAVGYNWSRLSLEAHLRGVGPIAWNEANSLWEPFYLIPGAQACLSLGRVRLYLRGENLSNTAYHAFYFKSVGNEFFQAGKPVSFIVGVQYDIL